MGKVAYRVQTLHGFAWRAHTSSLMAKAAAMLFSNLISTSH